MSEFSGKCDLADDFFLSMPDELTERFNNGDFSALQEYFEQYKESIGGVIYKPFHIDRITENNQELVAKYESAFTFEEHKETVQDRRYKNKEKVRTYYTYTYWGVEYTSLKELNNDNKDGFYLTIPQPIETIYDLIEFFPYIIGMSCGTKDELGKAHKYIRVSVDSWATLEYKNGLDWGYDSSEIYNHYKKELQEFRANCIKAGL